MNAQCVGLHLTLEQWTTKIPMEILMVTLMDSDGDKGLGFSRGLGFSHFSFHSSSFSGDAVGFRISY